MADASAGGMLVTVKVLIADDDAHVRAALRLLLQEQDDFVVVGETDSAETLTRCVLETTPDVLLLDWDLPRSGSTKVIAQLNASQPQLCVIAMSGRPEARAAALRQGVGAFICKGDAPDALLAALRTYAAAAAS